MDRGGLRIVTWNVWFGQLEREARRRALWEQIEAVDPDVVCLQEMLPEDLDGPHIARWRSRGYWVSDEHLEHYDALMLSRVAVTHHERVPMVSQMGRSLLLARLATPVPLTVATIHLESTHAMTQARVRQLQAIDARLVAEPNMVLVGDMNFCDEDEDETDMVSQWTDAWLELRPGDPGYTVDSTLNEMRYLHKGRHDRKRIDRVFTAGDGWRLRSIERLGTAALQGDPQTFVSDHFGLVVDLDPA